MSPVYNDISFFMFFFFVVPHDLDLAEKVFQILIRINKNLKKNVFIIKSEKLFYPDMFYFIPPKIK